MTRKVISSYNQEGGQGRQQSTWKPWLGGFRIAGRDAGTRDTRFGPLRLRSRQPRRSLIATTKREKKENNNQHEECD